MTLANALLIASINESNATELHSTETKGHSTVYFFPFPFFLMKYTLLSDSYM